MRVREEELNKTIQLQKLEISHLQEGVNVALDLANSSFLEAENGSTHITQVLQSI